MLCGNIRVMGKTVALLAGFGAIVLLSSGCGTKSESEQEKPLRDINAVMADHAAELMAIPGVTGTAIGELDDHTPCILILVEKETDKLKESVPKKIEGHPTKIYVVGKIVPMDDK